MTKRANRSILAEMLDADFEECVNAARRRVEQKKPTRQQLKQRGFIQYDWAQYIAGFKHIKYNAQDCLVEEFSHYKEKVRAHEKLAHYKFGV